MGGLNDIAEGCDERLFAQRYRTLLHQIQKELPTAEIIVQSILPVDPTRNDTKNAQIRQFNGIIERICREENLPYLDLYTLYADKDGNLPQHYTKDGTHLCPEAYRPWYTALRELIEAEAPLQTDREQANELDFMRKGSMISASFRTLLHYEKVWYRCHRL